MKTRVSLFLFAVLLVLSVAVAAADTRPLNVAIGYEQALNLGDLEAMTALFADDAVFYSHIGGEAITGHAAIREALAPWSRENRTYEIVSLNMTGNEMTIVVDIADRGIAWGRQTLRATVEDGLIQTMAPLAFRFLF